MGTIHAGPVEYAVAGLLIVQVVAARVWIARLRRHWLRLLCAGALALLCATTLAALWLVTFGTLYYTNEVPAGPGAAVIATGYLWIFMASLTLGIWCMLRLPVHGFTPPHSTARRQLMRAVGVTAVGGPLGAVGYGVFIERKACRVHELGLPVPDLHPDLEGFRIAQLSDLHVSPFLSAREAGRVIDMANELRPHLALFTGDLITERGDPLDAGIRELIRMRADLGVLGCMGNHEEYVGCRNYLAREAGRAGVVFLRGSAVQLRRGSGVLNVAGVDFQRFGRRDTYIRGAEKLVVPGAANMLLSHNPDVFPTAIAKGFQTVLSGHTHGGQVNVEILHRNVNPARFKTPYTSGLYRLDQASCFVNNGVGTIGMTIRLGAPPEIALLRLRRA